MNKNPSSRNSIARQSQAIYPKTSVFGFTLIEMLVVMVIIAILAGIILPTINKAYSRAKVATVQHSLRDFEIAVDSYRAEYGRLPIDGGINSSDVTLTGDDADIVISVLQGDNTVTNNPYIPNPKKINFYESDLVETDGVFKDPWGGSITIVFDANYDKTITVDGQNFKRNVVAQSYGPDGRSGTTDEKEDDIYSVRIED